MWDNHQALRLLANLLLGIAALAATYIIGSWAVNTSTIPLKQVKVIGANNSGKELKHVTREQIDKIVRSEIKGNFVTINLDAMREGFEKLPWVRVASLRRHWPQGLEVTLEEHVAVAHWGGEELVNSHGELFVGSVVGGEERLPIFIGPGGSSFDVVAQYVAFSKLLKPLQQDIAQLVLSPRRAWRIQLESGTVLELGRDRMEDRLLRYVSTYDRSVEQLNRNLTYVDLRYSNGFAVRTQETLRHENRIASVKKAA
jgi:cell division protein FtsQ